MSKKAKLSLWSSVTVDNWHPDTGQGFGKVNWSEDQTVSEGMEVFVPVRERLDNGPIQGGVEIRVRRVKTFSKESDDTRGAGKKRRRPVCMGWFVYNPNPGDCEPAVERATAEQTLAAAADATSGGGWTILTDERIVKLFGPR